MQSIRQQGETAFVHVALSVTDMLNSEVSLRNKRRTSKYIQ